MGTITVQVISEGFETLGTDRNRSILYYIDIQIMIDKSYKQ